MSTEIGAVNAFMFVYSSVAVLDLHQCALCGVVLCIGCLIHLCSTLYCIDQFTLQKV